MLNDNKKCNVCGHEQSVYESKCTKCGVQLKFNRHGFISFWLWLCCIINGIAFIGYAFLLFSSKGLWSATPEPIWMRLIWLIGSAVNLYSYIMLLNWKKSGFYILSGMCIVNVVMNMLIYGITFATFSPIIGLIILYRILWIKKDGVEYWIAMN